MADLQGLEHSTIQGYECLVYAGQPEILTHSAETYARLNIHFDDFSGKFGRMLAQNYLY